MAFYSCCVHACRICIYVLLFIYLLILSDRFGIKNSPYIILPLSIFISIISVSLNILGKLTKIDYVDFGKMVSLGNWHLVCLWCAQPPLYLSFI